MKFLFFTPTLRRSAIGRMATYVVRDLIAQGHQVVVIQSEATKFRFEERHGFNTKVIAWQDLKENDVILDSIDQIVFQVGNNYDFHEGCLHWMSKLPGIVSLHDFYLGHLFTGWAKNRRAEADEILRFWYGKGVANAFFQQACLATFIEDTLHTAPMTEWICSQATGVIIHSNWGSDRVLASCPGPVHVVPLAYEITPPTMTNEETVTKNSALQLLTIGNINPNKRIASVIKAIGASERLKAGIVYRLVGSIQPSIKEELFTLAKHSGVDLKIDGEVDDTSLTVALAECDVLCCLRWPVLESASASAIEGMLFGKAVLCTNAGFYSEIPENCVVKVSIEQEIPELTARLEDLLVDPLLKIDLGERAQAWASNTFVPTQYATSLVDISMLGLEALPFITACRSFSTTLKQWSTGSENTIAVADIGSLCVLSGTLVKGAR